MAIEIYVVGGAVRDEMLGLPVQDRDYVVVGATPEEMVKRGFRPVGRDFPVFLHPQTHEEHALARTERKTAPGYHGFAFHAAPDVTLEQDLQRRDLTINAMARDEAGRLIDPYHGAEDLSRGVLRHVSPAFAEDPVRILRVARFAARFGFTVAPETQALMAQMVRAGEADALVAERVWQELAKGLAEPRPSRMIEALAASGALRALLPEVDGLFGDARGAKLLRALDHAAARGFALPVRYAVLLQTLGTEDSPTGTAAATRTARAVRLAERVSERLRAPTEARDLARLAARHRATVHRADALRPAEWLELFAAADALRRPERLAGLVDACECDALAAPAAGNTYPPRGVVDAAFGAVREVDAGAAATAAIAAAAKAGAPAGSDAIAKAVRAARLAALRRWRSGPARPA